MSVEFAALVISAAAFVLSGWAAWNSHRQADQSRRQADAAEDQLSIMREERDAAEAAQEALDARPWHLTHYKGDTYRLTNDGSSVAYDVHVDGDPWRQWIEAPGESKIGPGESATFMAVMHAGISRRMTFRWATQPGGPVREMSELLPQKF